MTDTDVAVPADSTLNAISDGDAAFGTLTLSNDATLSLTGTATEFSFAGLSGDGTVGPDVTVRDGLSPGGSIGTLAVGRNLTVEDGVVYSWELNLTNDLVNVTGDLALGAWTLEILDAGLMRTILPTEEFVLFNYGTLSGGLGSPTILDATGLGYRFSTAGAQIVDDADDNQVILTGILAVVPEPTTIAVWSLLAALGIGCGWYRRRK
jgi:hypothetical protein